ncbi:alpha-2,8-sialyltransferase 8B-like, partial [Saccoglossus kowalevskii]
FSSGDLIRIFNKNTSIEDMNFNQSNRNLLNKSTYQLPRQKSCAVVGNSGILLNSSCGEEIDSNDLVIRCNIPDVWNYIKDVGNKTDINIIFQRTMRDLYYLLTNGTIAHYMLPTRLHIVNNTILWYPESFRSERVTANTAKVALRYLKYNMHLNFQFAISATHGFTGNLGRSIKVARPTTGMRAIVAALSLCEYVNVFGFYPYVFDQNGNKVLYHYYGTNRTIEDFVSSHDYSNEFAILQQLHSNNVLRLVTGECK